jgi:hypothetical protein
MGADIMTSAWGNSWGASWGVSWGGLQVPSFQQIWIIDERVYRPVRKVKRAKKATLNTLRTLTDLKEIIAKKQVNARLLEEKLKKAAEQLQKLEAENDFLDVQQRLLDDLNGKISRAVRQIKLGGLGEKQLTLGPLVSSETIYAAARYLEEQDDLETLQLFMMLA